MTGARLAAAFFALALAASGAVAAPPPAAPPRWSGPLPPDAPAVARSLATDDEKARWDDEVRLVELGEAALPALLQAAAGDDPRVREAVAAVMLGMCEEGVLPGNPAVARALAMLIRSGGEAGERAGAALEGLMATAGRHAAPSLIGLLRETDPYLDREVRAAARRLLAAAADRDLGPDAGVWAGWWGGEEKRYLERERVRPLPMPTAEEFERASQSAMTSGRERIRLLQGGLERRRAEPPVPRGGRWRLELVFDMDARLWPWGVYPARVWLLQGTTRVAARLLPALDLKQERNALRALAVAPADLDPDQRTALAVQMVDARDGSSFLLALSGVRFREGR